MAFCENCGAPISDTAKFCRSCGAKIDVSASYSTRYSQNSSSSQGLSSKYFHPETSPRVPQYGIEDSNDETENQSYQENYPYDHRPSESSSTYDEDFDDDVDDDSDGGNSSWFSNFNLNQFSGKILGIIGFCLCCLTMVFWPLCLISVGICILGLFLSIRSGRVSVLSIIGLIVAAIGLIMTLSYSNKSSANTATGPVLVNNPVSSPYVVETVSPSATISPDNDAEVISETPSPTETPVVNTPEPTPLTGVNGIVFTTLTKNMSLGAICNTGTINKSLYMGLSCVRTTTSPTNAFGTSVDLSAGNEALYAFLELYNPTNEVKSFSDWGISAYVDGIQVSDLDDVFLASCDGIDAMQSYEIDPGMKMVVLLDFEVPQGWSEFSLYYDSDCYWTISSSDVSDVPYDTSASLYSIDDEHALTEVGDIIYADLDKEIKYDGFTIWSYDTWFDGIKDFIIFEFQISAVGEDELDYSLVGYNMRCYQNGTLLDDAEYNYTDETIDGYTNIFNLDSIQSGMSAKVFVAFEVGNLTDGEYTLSYDEGYLINNPLAMVYANYTG